MRRLRQLLLAGLLGAALIGARARTVRDALLSMPFELMAPVAPETLTDLLDYAEAGRIDHVARNDMGGNAQFLALDSLGARLQTGEGRILALQLLPTAGDTLLLLTETLAAPQPDSRTAVYSSKWKELRPISPEVAATAPSPEDILLYEHVYDPDSRTLKVLVRAAGNDAVIAETSFPIDDKFLKKLPKRK